MMYLLINTLKNNQKVPEYYRKPVYINGDVSMEERENVKKLLETPDHNIILLNNAGCEGINLQICSVILFFDQCNSAGAYLQTIGRISRLNSKNKTLLTYSILTEDSIEVDAYLKIHQQMLLMEKVLDKQESGQVIDYDALKSHDMLDLDIAQAQSAETLNQMIIHRLDKHTDYYLGKRSKNPVVLKKD